jgi:uncharacterized membrane protein
MGENETAGAGKPFSDDDKIYLFLAYFGILSLVPFLMFKDKRSDPQKDYVYWHARQGLALAICWFVCSMIWILPFVGWLIGCVVWVAGLVFMIMGWVKAFGGIKWEMPGVSKIAEMFN